MTLGVLDIEEIKKRLTERNKSIHVPELSTPQSSTDEVHLSGKVLAERLEGLLSEDEANLIEQHINESCEQEND